MPRQAPQIFPIYKSQIIFPLMMRSNDDDRRQWRKQGGVVGAAASKTQVPSKARCGCWVPQPVRSGGHSQSFHTAKSRRTKSAAALRGVTSQPALCDDPPHTGQIDSTQQMLQYDQHGILPSDRPFQPSSPFSKIRSSFVKLPPPKRSSSGPRP